jgi:peptidoglycan/xylan/chitin deacetylase (PgdA/CDA1 family)
MSTAYVMALSDDSANDAARSVSPGLVTANKQKQAGALVISLDFELHWGVRDITPLDSGERARLLSARRLIPSMLDLFEEFSISATWATVGLLFAHSKEEAEAFMPKERPKYRESRLDPYSEKLGSGEDDDPFHFAPTLIAQIANRPGQEIACHSFSHYYGMEQGQTADDFEADLKSAVAIAANAGYKMRSYVFPRNEVNREYLPALKRAGIRAYRGTESVSIKQGHAFAEQRRPHRRIGRLLDSYLDVCGAQTVPWPEPSVPASIASSRYLRPYSPVFSPFESLLHRRIDLAMKHAAEQGEIFHLWWHPEDFAHYADENLQFLRRVLKSFAGYRAEYGMASLSMADLMSRVGCADPR